jgi:hypothetical protein
MPASRIHVHSEKPSSVWKYPQPNRTAGAFRAISVAALRNNPPSIELYEWNDGLNNNGGDLQPTEDLPSRPKYAAISHVWKSSKAVENTCRQNRRPLKILKESKVAPGSFERGEHEISWQGLIEAANAAHHRRCGYIWLDLLCIDQVRNVTDDGEKKKQINNMGLIYERADIVFIMVGGVGAVQRIDEVSSWIDRAWTLQEAVVCPNTTVLVDWPYASKFNAPPIFRDPNDGPNKTFHVEFTKVEDSNLAYIGLKTLLELQLTGGQMILDLHGKHPPSQLPPEFAIKCFESNVHDAKSDILNISAGRMALLAVLEASAKNMDNKVNKEMKHSAVWRSMHLRVSTNQEDIVFSIQHLLDVKLDHTDGLDLPELYNKLVEKVTIAGIPAWLGVGASSGDIIPRHKASGICPDLPIREKLSQQNSETRLPKYTVGVHSAPVSKFISRSGDYIAKFDLEFKNWGSTNEQICCRMFQFKATPLLAHRPLAADAGESKSAILEYPGVKGVCAYKYYDMDQKPMGTKVNIIVIGQIQWLERVALPVSEPNHNSWYVYIVQKTTVNWVRVGAGMFSILDGDIPPNRTHMIFGNKSTNQSSDWTCDCQSRQSERNSWKPYPNLDQRSTDWSGEKLLLETKFKVEKGQMEAKFEAKYDDLVAETEETRQALTESEDANDELNRRIQDLEDEKSRLETDFASRLQQATTAWTNKERDYLSRLTVALDRGTNDAYLQEMSNILADYRSPYTNHRDKVPLSHRIC